MSNRSTGGFTRRELIVVLVIIGLIAAVVVPAFNSARESVRNVECVKNLIQVSVALQQYTEDYNDTYPLALSAVKRHGVSTIVRWQDRLLPYAHTTSVFRCPDRDRNDPPDTDYTFDMPRLNVFHPPFPTKTVTGARASSLKTPSTIWTVMDTVWSTEDGILHNGVRVHGSCWRSVNASTRHRGGGNYLFADGHVTWMTPSTFGAVDCKNAPLPAPFHE